MRYMPPRSVAVWVATALFSSSSGDPIICVELAPASAVVENDGTRWRPPPTGESSARSVGRPARSE